MNPPAIQFVGDDALRFHVENLAHRAAIAEQLRQTGPWLEVVPGRVDICVLYDPVAIAPDDARDLLKQNLERLEALESNSVEKPVTLDVIFSTEVGPELKTCAEQNGLSIDTFIGRLITSDLVVDLIGFTPGFAYVGGVDPSLKARRLDHPRAHVPAGAVGFISGSLGLYALPGPAGWPIIGKATTPLFNPEDQEPILLKMGQSVCLRVQPNDP